MTLYCYMCTQHLAPDLFYNSRRNVRRGGKDTRCKTCSHARNRERYNADLGAARAAQRRLIAAPKHVASRKAYTKQYYAREDIKQRCHEYRQTEFGRAMRKRSEAKSRMLVSLSYAKHVIVANGVHILKIKDVPDELAALKRMQLFAHRMLQAFTKEDASAASLIEANFLIGELLRAANGDDVR